MRGLGRWFRRWWVSEVLKYWCPGSAMIQSSSIESSHGMWGPTPFVTLREKRSRREIEMPLMLNTIFKSEGIDLSDIRLLRHKDGRADKGRSPYELWRDSHSQFNGYQSTQSLKNASKLDAPFWAAFVGTPTDETLFVGFYRVSNRRLLEFDQPMPHTDGVDKAGSCHLFDLERDARFDDFVGKLIIEWGTGERAWIQRADNQNKIITELRPAFKEPAFPGFLNFIAVLSRIDSLPLSWVAALQACRGVYLLTCPKTKEQYVGSASGDGAFWRRWMDYATNGHGGNVALKSRDPSDYQVSILEVAGSSATDNEILLMESRWKSKLQSQEMGLNRN